jgi:hypothetical protein
MNEKLPQICLFCTQFAKFAPNLSVPQGLERSGESSWSFLALPRQQVRGEGSSQGIEKGKSHRGREESIECSESSEFSQCSGQASQGKSKRCCHLQNAKASRTEQDDGMEKEHFKSKVNIHKHSRDAGNAGFGFGFGFNCDAKNQSMSLGLSFIDTSRLSLKLIEHVETLKTAKTVDSVKTASSSDSDSLDFASSVAWINDMDVILRAQINHTHPKDSKKAAISYGTAITSIIFVFIQTVLSMTITNVNANANIVVNACKDLLYLASDTPHGPSQSQRPASAAASASAPPQAVQAVQAQSSSQSPGSAAASASAPGDPQAVQAVQAVQTQSSSQSSASAAASASAPGDPQAFQAFQSQSPGSAFRAAPKAKTLMLYLAVHFRVARTPKTTPTSHRKKTHYAVAQASALVSFAIPDRSLAIIASIIPTSIAIKTLSTIIIISSATNPQFVRPHPIPKVSKSTIKSGGLAPFLKNKGVHKKFIGGGSHPQCNIRQPKQTTSPPMGYFCVL